MALLMSGAGFMTQGGSQNDDSSGDTYERSSRHFTVKQIQQMPEQTPFAIDGAPVKNALLVGLITDVSPKGSRTVFGVTDGTGEITLTLFSANANEGPPEIHQGQYALLSVMPRLYADKVQFTASNIIQPIPYSQVINHELTALREHLHFTGAKPFDGVAATKQKTEPKEADSQPADLFDPYGDEVEQKRVLLENLNTEEPTSLDALCRTFKCDRDHMERLLKDLSNDGRIWDDGEGQVTLMES